VDCNHYNVHENFIIELTLPYITRHKFYKFSKNVIAHHRQRKCNNILIFRLAYGNESGLVIVDIVQKISLVVLNTSDLGGGDPYQRVLRSPKRQDELKRENEDKARSPSTDQVKCISFSTRTVYILNSP